MKRMHGGPGKPLTLIQRRLMMRRLSSDRNLAWSSATSTPRHFGSKTRWSTLVGGSLTKFVGRLGP